VTIKRCPYCRSIIDEVDRYCNNCGTQLLFPEDENVEEPIPGDRIVEVEEDSRQREDLVLDSIKPKSEPGKASRPQGLSPDLPVDKEDLILPSADRTKPEKSPELDAGQETVREFLTRELPEMGRVEPPAPSAPQAPRAEARRQKSESPARDFESGFPTSGREMEEIARLMSTLEKKEKVGPDIRSSSKPQSSFLEKDLASARQEEEKPKPPSGAQEQLPPWAERVKEGETPGFRASTQEGISRERGDFEFELPSEPAALRPDDTGEASTVPSSDDFYNRRGGEEESPLLGQGVRPRRRKPKRGAGARLKARVYDLLFITLFWILAVWASSRLLGLSLFELVQTSSLEIGIFYLILLVGYFALFLSFLGETLGDRLGSSAR
jgi:hypothetical protein